MSAAGRASPAGPEATPAAPVRVTRSQRSAVWAGLFGIVVVAVLAYLPYAIYSGGYGSVLIQAFYLLAMATMWNLLAGYAGLVSVGQQAFVGMGAYLVLILALHGTEPFAAVPVAALGCGILGLVVWWLVSRLRTGYFAIATWVIASICELIISRFTSLGGGTGMGVPRLPSNTTLLSAATYWAALAVAVAAVGGAYLILRSRTGLVLTALRDDETGARSVGARVGRAQRYVFVVAAVGCGAAGGVYAISQQFIEPTSSFAVQWSAQMIFIVIIGGLGTIEGPILGTIIYMVLQQVLSGYGTWYLIILGAVAMVIAIWAPRGLWGQFANRFGIRLFPVGYHVWPPGTGRPGLAQLLDRARSRG